MCGYRLPDDDREVLIQRGCGTILGSGQTIWHCPVPAHSILEIQTAISAQPRFQKASEIK